MKPAELFVRCVENESVEYIFGVPAEENVDIMDACLGCRSNSSPLDTSKERLLCRSPVDYSENMKLTRKLEKLISLL